MDKDAYYFPHFCNSKSDRKILRVRRELGLEGYGIFFMLLETLREQADLSYPIQDIDLLADEFGTSEQKVRTVITNYDLFEVDEEEQFFSPKLILYLGPYFRKKEQARFAGIASGIKRREMLNDRSTTVQRMLNENEQSKVKKSKVKKSKEDESKEDESKEYIGTVSDETVQTVKPKRFVKPNLEEVQGYCIERSNEVDPEKFIDFYESNGWKVGKNSMKDWKASVRTWEKSDIGKSKFVSFAEQREERVKKMLEEVFAEAEVEESKNERK